MSLETFNILWTEYKESQSCFYKSMKEYKDCKYGGSLKDYERAINNSLELQYQASYCVSVVYRLMTIMREAIKRGGTDILKYKKVYEDLNTSLEEFKSYVYTFSQRAKCLSDIVKTKQMASPDTLR